MATDTLPPEQPKRPDAGSSDWDDYIAELEGGATQAMVCAQCKFAVDSADDVALRLRTKVICARCYARITEDEHPMSRQLQNEIRSAMGSG